MNFLLVVMLAGLWFWLLLPGVLRDRRPRSPIASVDAFERFMDTLGPLTDPQANTVDLEGPEFAAFRRRSGRFAVLRRRRRVFRGLIGAVVTTFAVASVFGEWAWWLAGTGATLLVLYTLLLIRMRRRSELQDRVRRLPERDEEYGDQVRQVRERQSRPAVEG
ncbi:MAG: hypothetical protein GEU81_08210 [Nitriliruptorales bacterium]|nr:hypothetical protein [Nitriliruptorales bacterium]